MWISIDVESDGPIPGDNSMISFGAVLIKADGNLDTTFYGTMKSISDKWVPEALAISGFTREETMAFRDPREVMTEFGHWLSNYCGERPMFISDNNGYDFMFMHWYFIHFTGMDPFGHSSTNLGSLYKGLVKDTFKNFKHLRKTRHSHHPVDDCKGNAEAFLTMVKEMGLRAEL